MCSVLLAARRAQSVGRGAVADCPRSLRLGAAPSRRLPPVAMDRSECRSRRRFLGHNSSTKEYGLISNYGCRRDARGWRSASGDLHARTSGATLCRRGRGPSRGLARQFGSMARQRRRAAQHMAKAENSGKPRIPTWRLRQPILPHGRGDGRCDSRLTLLDVPVSPFLGDGPSGSRREGQGELTGGSPRLLHIGYGVASCERVHPNEVLPTMFTWCSSTVQVLRLAVRDVP